ncbi:FecR family protein [Pedobacter jeongneungensis]|uniref:FecR family protein n=1 Tax=Pedobacter jeongneungensis TaxID=947309 RepID=UPI000469B875|nr:FecR domain-containing protein [Pedobacter jeongneungensis]
MKKQLSDYKAYTLADLINDETFILWVIQPDETADTFWQNVQNTFPNLIPLIVSARNIVLSMRFETDELSTIEQQQLWQNIEAKTILVKKTGRTLPMWYRYAAAAVVAGILFCIGVLYSVNQKVNIETPYGQLKNITLPDGSIVTLNANSQIKYDKNWDKDEIREVWISGEAFLKVNHLHQRGAVQNHERFIVHTGAVNVEVLGTSFNVNDRRGHTEVALLEGKISLDLKTGETKPLILAPGDIAEYANGKLVKKPINVAEYASWKDGKLYFRNVPVAKIFDYFEDIYGYKVVVDDPKILEKRLSGTLSAKDRGVLFKAIGVTLNISISPKEATNELIVTSK